MNDQIPVSEMQKIIANIGKHVSRDGRGTWVVRWDYVFSELQAAVKRHEGPQPQVYEVLDDMTANGVTSWDDAANLSEEDLRAIFGAINKVASLDGTWIPDPSVVVASSDGYWEEKKRKLAELFRLRQEEGKLKLPKAEHDLSPKAMMTYCRERAGRAWCAPATSHLAMNPELADQFAQILADEIRATKDFERELWEEKESGSGAKKD